MTDKQTEALKLALEALEPFTTPKWAGTGVDKANEAYVAICEALAEQPAPPPECQTEAEKTAFAFGWWKALEHVRQQPAQRTWVGLTDEEVLDMARTFGAQPWPTNSCAALGKMIEAKLREKNT